MRDCKIIIILFCQFAWTILSSSKHIFLCLFQTLENGTNVIQLETAVGAAIKSFEGAVGINVPRRRFLPVKTTSDLLVVMSNLYGLRTGALEMSPKRSFPSVPLTKLGTHFSKVFTLLIIQCSYLNNTCVSLSVVCQSSVVYPGNS